MKQIHLKGKKEHKRIRIILLSLILVLSTLVTFNYLNKNIYEYNTKEYIDMFTRISFSFENNIDLLIDKMIDFYDQVTNNEVVKR